MCWGPPGSPSPDSPHPSAPAGWLRGHQGQFFPTKDKALSEWGWGSWVWWRASYNFRTPRQIAVWCPYLKDEWRVKLHHRNAISKIQIVENEPEQMVWFLPK